MHPIESRPPRYRSYLLRCWETGGGGPQRPATWRFSLQDSETGQKRGFADLEALVTYLQTALASEIDGESKAQNPL